jgi:D-galactarolactone cycloisomerase
MKIVALKPYLLQSPLAQPFAFSQGWVNRRSATLVEVTTDEGVSGWGEAFAQGLEPPQIAASVIESALAPLLVGANPLDTEVLWHRMYHATRDYGRKGSVVAAISAVDIALWDIAGRVYGRPVHQLLGGAFRSRVQVYATGFYRISGQGEAKRLGEEAIAHYEAGFRAMKVKLGYGLRDDIAVMEAVRAALGSREVTLMVDTNHAYGVADAIRLGRALEPYDLRWYEEPVVPEDLTGYGEVRRAVSMPVAGGENEHTLFGFRELFAQRCVDVAQPDNGVQVNPHVWGSAVAQAASLQLIAAVPAAHHSVFAQQPIFEYDRSSHPFRQHLVREPLEQRDGWLEVPTRPGLGIEIDRGVLERYRA